MAVNAGSAVGYLDLDISNFLDNLNKANDTAKKKLSGIEKVASDLQNAGKSLSSFGDNISKYVTVPLVGAATAFASLALAGGFKRLVALDTAQAKLEALGFSAEQLEVILGNVDFAVTDTAFTLDEAMTSAVSAIASGVKEGQDLQDYLVMIGDSASLAGISYGEMGAIMNKVQARGKTDLDVMNQLAERGIPIIAWLGETYNKTQAEILDMNKEGEISSEMFFKSVSEHVDGMSVAMGNTVPAKMANVKSAINRIGAAFLGAGEDGETTFDNFKDVLDRVLEGVRSLIPEAKKLGEEFAVWLNKSIDKVTELVEAYRGLTGWKKTVINYLAVFAVSIGPVLSVLGRLITTVGTVTGTVGKLTTAFSGSGVIGGKLVPLMSKIGSAIAGVAPTILKVVGIVGLLIGVFVTLWNNNEEFKESIIAIWERIKEAFTRIVVAIAGIFGDFESDTGSALETLKNAFGAVLEFVKMLWSHFSELFGPVFIGLFDVVANVLEALAGIIEGVINTVSSLIQGDWTGAWEAAKSIVFSVLGLLKDQFITILNTISGVIGVFLSWFGVNWEEVLTNVKDFFINIWDNITSFVSSTVENIKSFFTNLWEHITSWGSDVINSAIEIGSGFFTGIIDFFKQLPENVSNWITNVFERIKEWKDNLISTAKETGENFLESIVEFFSDLPYKIGYWLGFALGSIIRFGIDIVTKAKEMAEQFIANITIFFKELPSKIKAWVTSAYENVKQWATNMWTKAKEMAEQFIANVTTFFKELPAKVKAWLISTYENVKRWASDMWAKAKEMAINFVTNAIDQIKQLPAKIWTWLVETVNKVKRWATDMVARAKEAITNFINSAITLLRELPSKIWTWLKEATAKAGKWAKDMAQKGKEAITQMINAVVNTAKSIASKVVQIGKDIVNGVWRGIKSSINAFTANVKSFFTGIVDGVKSALKIKSPSQLFADEVGEQIPAGVEQGAEAEMPHAIKGINDSLNKEINKMDTDDIEVDYEADGSLDGIDSVFDKVKKVYNEVLVYFESIEQQFVNSLDKMSDSLYNLIKASQEVQTQGNALGYVGYDGFSKNTSAETNTRRSDRIAPERTGGDSFTFISPKPIDEVEAARLLRKTKRDLAEDF